MKLGFQTITRVRAKIVEDSYHNQVQDFAAGDRPPNVAIEGCSVQPGGGSQTFDSREAITTLYTVWAPLDADVTDVDRIIHAGTTYDIDGSVERWEVGSPLDHLVIRLKKVAG